MKTGPTWNLSLAAVALVCLGGLSGCNRADGDRAKTSLQQGASQAAQAVDDSAVTAKVKAVLAAEKDLASSRISVTTTEGRVTLTGSVPPGQIARAEQIVRGIDGVREVDNRLKPGNSTTS